MTYYILANREDCTLHNFVTPIKPYQMKVDEGLLIDTIEALILNEEEDESGEEKIPNWQARCSMGSEALVVKKETIRENPRVARMMAEDLVYNWMERPQIGEALQRLVNRELRPATQEEVEALLEEQSEVPTLSLLINLSSLYPVEWD